MQFAFKIHLTNLRRPTSSRSRDLFLINVFNPRDLYYRLPRVQQIIIIKRKLIIIIIIKIIIITLVALHTTRIFDKLVSNHRFCEF